MTKKNLQFVKNTEKKHLKNTAGGDGIFRIVENF